MEKPGEHLGEVCSQKIGCVWSPRSEGSSENLRNPEKMAWAGRESEETLRESREQGAGEIEGGKPLRGGGDGPGFYYCRILIK